MSIWNWNNFTSPPEPNVVRAMPLVLRMEKNSPVLYEDALIATVKAVATLLDEKVIHKSKQFRHEIETWSQGDIRKVSRRARGARWSDLTNVPGVTVEVGTAQVRAILPYDVQYTPTPVSRLQVSGLECVHVKSEPIESASGITLQVAVNPDVKMSTGKQMAQVGHIAHLAALQTERKVLEGWKMNNFAVHMVPFDPQMPLTIRDMGLTEVPSGTRTAVGGFTQV